MHRAVASVLAPSSVATSAPDTSTTAPQPADAETTSSTAPASEDPDPVLRLRGKTFVGTERTEAGAQRPLVEGTKLTVRFHRNEHSGDDIVAWSGGCNTAVGTVAVTRDQLDVTADTHGMRTRRNDYFFVAHDRLTYPHAVMSLIRQVREWLDRPVGKMPEPDTLVELTRYPRRIDAENAVSALERSCIPAAMFSADADGWAPHLGAADGNRVMVRFRDLETAAAVIERLS